MKHFVLTAILFSVFLSTGNANNQVTLPISQPKIVGGEITEEYAYPWMSTLVYAYSELTTSLAIGNREYSSEYFANSPTGSVSGEIVDCGNGGTLCSAAANKICLMSRGDINFSDKANNCQSSGGIAAIIYNNTVGDISGTLGDDFKGNIPVIAISQSDGALLQSNLNGVAAISVTEEESILQNAVCGASFIGDKWLITAAHCLVDANLTYLKVNVGEYDLSTTPETLSEIKQVYIHPEYDVGEAYENDIALIELTQPLEQASIPLIDYATSEQLSVEGSLATVIGWGNQVAYGPDDDVPGNSQPDILRQADVYLLNTEQCRDKLVEAYFDYQAVQYSTNQVGIAETMLCSNYPGGGSGSCQGDSGGPLIVETNEGLQQIGIVSYGIGCGEPLFPDVYTKVASYHEWISNITEGIAIKSSHQFPLTPQLTGQSTSLTVSNNSQYSVNLTFNLVNNTQAGNNFSLDSSNCSALSVNESCQLIVHFDALDTGEKTAAIIVLSDNADVAASKAVISAEALPANSSINTQLPGGATEFLWYSGGNSRWQASNSDNSISSGNITDNQESVVMLAFNGSGTLSFEWSVSSEENVDDPTTPFDALYLFIDDQEYNFISGNVAYSPINIDIPISGDHIISWVYKKDELETEGEDKGYLRNVTFTPYITTIPSDNTDGSISDNEPLLSDSDTPSPASDSSGGTMYVLLCLLLLRVKRHI